MIVTPIDVYSDFVYFSRLYDPISSRYLEHFEEKESVSACHKMLSSSPKYAGGTTWTVVVGILVTRLEFNS